MVPLFLIKCYFNFMKTEEDIIREGYKHGDEFECPLCGAPGRLDIDTLAGEQPEFELSVWYNSHISGWECTECWLK